MIDSELFEDDKGMREVHTWLEFLYVAGFNPGVTLEKAAPHL